MKPAYLVRLVFIHLFFLSIPYFAVSYPEQWHAEYMPRSLMQSHPEEGFVAGTLIRVPDGFKCIEAITEQDVVCAEQLKPKRVLKTAKQVAQQYIRVEIEEEIVGIGCDQVVRVPSDLIWHSVSALQQYTYVLDVHGKCRIIGQCELIAAPTILYQLEVEDHAFCVGYSCVVVHNADIATLGVATLFLEYVAYAHPVIAVIGSTIALSTIARNAYETYMHNHQHNYTDNTCDETPPVEIFLAERYYYEQRKKELITLRDEFAALYRGITAIQDLFDPQITTFSSQLLQATLKHHTPHAFLAIALVDELKLSDERKSTLRTMREQELKLLEKEITELHAMLVVHFNALMVSVFEACEIYEKLLPTINQAVDLWNLHKDGKLTDHIASQLYEQSIIEESLLRDIQQKIVELKVVVTFYQKNKHRICLQQSTDILNWLDGLAAMIADNEQWTAKDLICVNNNLSVTECYFAQRGIPTTGFKNQVKSAFHKDRSQKNAQVLKKAKDTQADMCASGGPNDPKKDNEKNKDTVDAIKGAQQLTDEIEKEARKRGWENPGMPSKDDKATLNHIFPKEKNGHDTYSDVAYKEMQELVKDPNNFVGKDKNGSQWFSKKLPDGREKWARAYGAKVRSGGTNDQLSIWHEEFGLMKPGSDTYLKYLRWLDENMKGL